MSNLSEMTIKDLVALHNQQAGAEQLSGWKGKKDLLIEKVKEAIKKARGTVTIKSVSVDLLMATDFTDNDGRTWELSISVSAVKRLRAHLELDLFALVEGEQFEGLTALVRDPVRLVDCVYVLCKPQADAAGVTDERFGEAMAGDAILRAADAFMRELADFFPSPRVRAALTKLVETWGRHEARLDALVMAQLEALDLDAELERLIDSSGDSPGSSASTPAPSR